MMRRAMALVAVLGALGCADAVTSASTLRVSAVKEASGIRLSNLTGLAIGYAIFDAQTLAVIDWAPCATQSPDCLRLPAHGSVFVPFDEILLGGATSKEVTIYNWWVLTDIEGSPQVDMDEPLTLRL